MKNYKLILLAIIVLTLIVILKTTNAINYDQKTDSGKNSTADWSGVPKLK